MRIDGTGSIPVILRESAVAAGMDGGPVLETEVHGEVRAVQQHAVAAVEAVPAHHPVLPNEAIQRVHPRLIHRDGVRLILVGHVEVRGVLPILRTEFVALNALEIGSALAEGQRDQRRRRHWRRVRWR